MTSAQRTDLKPQIPEFGDGKDAGALRTIGEVAGALGIKQHVLRYWEEQFSTLRPLTRAGGRRYYRPDDIALIMQINRLLHHEGYTIKGAKQALTGKPLNAKRVRSGSPGGAAGLPPIAEDATLDTADTSTEMLASQGLLIESLSSIRDRLAAAIRD